MSHQSTAELNERVVRRLVDGFNNNDPSVIDELVAEDCVLHGAPPGPAREQWKETFGQMHAAFGPIRTEIDHLVAEGDYVVVYETTRATQKGPFLGFEPTGKSGEAPAMLMVELADGQIVARWQVVDLLLPLIQLGHITP